MSWSPNAFFSTHIFCSGEDFFTLLLIYYSPFMAQCGSVAKEGNLYCKVGGFDSTLALLFFRPVIFVFIFRAKLIQVRKKAFGDKNILR